MKKKLLTVLLAALAVCTCLSACTKNEEVKEEAAEEIVEEAETAEPTEEVVEETVEEETREGMYRSELTNEWIDAALENQRPVAIMVDNEKTALDHYGLTQADIVYEIMNSTANGEITRFMCIVKDWESITRFGSIRSVRPTHFMVAPEYNAVLVHDGGPFYIEPYLTNPWVDHLSGGFARIDNGKSREFTEYVTTGEIAARMEANGYDLTYNEYYEGSHWNFTNEENPVDLASAADSIACTFVDLPFPHNASELAYDAETNTYLYSEYGMPHIDPENDNKQLAFTNIILQSCELNQLDENGYMEFNILNNSGAGYYITGGQAIPVTWEKGSDCSITKYYDANGNEITLNTGKTYVGFVSNERWPEVVLQ